MPPVDWSAQKFPCRSRLAFRMVPKARFCRQNCQSNHCGPSLRPMRLEKTCSRPSEAWVADAAGLGPTGAKTICVEVQPANIETKPTPSSSPIFFIALFSSLWKRCQGRGMIGGLHLWMEAGVLASASLEKSASTGRNRRPFNTSPSLS